MSKGTRGQNGKHILASDDTARMEVSKGPRGQEESTYFLEMTRKGGK